MAAERGTFRYYEGTCSSGNFVKQIAKVLCLGVRDENNDVFKDSNWDIVYPICPTGAFEAEDPDIEKLFDKNITEEEYKAAMEKISTDQLKAKITAQDDLINDSVILRTTTNRQKENEGASDDDLTVDESDNESSHTMYLEIFKPKYLANPELYPLDCERRGIIPRVATKEMYIDALNSNASFARNIYEEMSSINKSTEYVRIDGIEYGKSYEEICKYALMMKKAVNTDSNNEIDNGGNMIDTQNRPVPLNSFNDEDKFPKQEGINWLFDKFDLNIIKNSSDAYEFYTKILSLLNINEQEYAYIDSIDAHFNYKEGGTYDFSISAHKKLLVYSISAGSVYTLDEDPSVSSDATEKLKPELYLDGTYISLPSIYYESNRNSITFLKDFSFCAQKYHDALEGVLVIRYEKERNNIAETFNDVDIVDRTTMLNNHYVLMRVFDNINDDKDAPRVNDVDANGDVVNVTSHVSPWAKLSWYKDFEEVMIDSIDDDDGTASISDGTIFVPIETPGLSVDTKIKFWINTNNERFTLVVMGNPSLDYEKERHLISACYCGSIESFANSINDTSGNFALFTSSSTEPCYTNIESIKSEYPMIYERGIPKNMDDPKNVEEFINDMLLLENSELDIVSGKDTYYINLSGNSFFMENQVPCYTIIDTSTNEVKVSYRYAESHKFIKNKNSDKSSQLAIRICSTEGLTDSCKLFVNYGYYTHKYIINSGVTRDVFGNVIDVKKEQSYGLNTSDGVTSIMMYHTRSKAYYQKHHMLFATTEEYMSKVMYGKSAYTGEYYADRIKVTHGNDGPRGILRDMLVIDNSSLYASDELVVNKDFKNDEHELEETYIYFPITAPYSPLSDSPNALYGIAIKKADRELVGTDKNKWISKAVEEINRYMENKKHVTGDSIILPDSAYYNKVKIFWNTKNNDNTLNVFLSNENGEYDNKNLIESAYEQNFALIDSDEVPSIDEDGYTVCHLRLSSIYCNKTDVEDPNDKIFFGISDNEISNIKKDSLLSVEYKAPFDEAYTTSTDKNNGYPKSFEYSLSDRQVNAGDSLERIDGDFEVDHEDNYYRTIDVYNASPSKWITLYRAVPGSNGEWKIIAYHSYPLSGTPTNSLLQYPNTVMVSRTSINGRLGITYTKNNESTSIGSTALDSVEFISVKSDYDNNISIKVYPDDGYTLDETNTRFLMNQKSYGELENDEDVDTNIGYKVTNNTIVTSKLTGDVTFQVAFKKTEQS